MKKLYVIWDSKKNAYLGSGDKWVDNTKEALKYMSSDIVEKSYKIMGWNPNHVTMIEIEVED